MCPSLVRGMEAEVSLDALYTGQGCLTQPLSLPRLTTIDWELFGSSECSTQFLHLRAYHSVIGEDWKLHTRGGRERI